MKPYVVAPAPDRISTAQRRPHHMTNSRLTDPEVLELRFPVLLESFGIAQTVADRANIRADGAIRRLRFPRTDDRIDSSQRRKVPPFGLAGGAPGQIGYNYVVKFQRRTHRSRRDSHD